MLQTPDPYSVLPPVPTFVVRSDDIADGREIPVAQRSPVMGDAGEDRSPHLAWQDFPGGTMSFAITCFDPDAPTGSGYWHWAVFNVPASVTELPTGAGTPGAGLLPDGAGTVFNDAREKRYLGAAPPPGTGTHRYIFTVHALDVDRLEIDDDATPAALGFNLVTHALGRATLTGIAAPA